MTTTRPAAATLRLRTARLDLVAGTPALGRAELRDRGLFAGLLGARVPAAWPPPENDERTMTFFTEYVEAHPEDVGWAAWYVLLRDEDDHRTAIGGCGFTGAPDGTGTVETGYSILEKYQRRGFAPEALSAIVGWALTHATVSRIVAHTSPSHRPSIRVLEKCGFTLVGAGTEPGTIRFELRRPVRRRGQASRGDAARDTGQM